MTEIPANWPTTQEEEAYWQDIGRQFMVGPEEIYLNTGSWGVQAKSVFNTLVRGLETLEANPTRTRKDQLQEVATSREALARFVNAPPEDLTFVTNVTVALNHVLLGLTWQLGDEILTSDHEYGAIDNCIHYVTERWGAVIRRANIPVPPSDPEEILEAVRREITDRTRLLVISHVVSRTGLITPVKALADLAHEHGILIAIDGAHAPGMIPIDLTDYGVDFYGGNCHKWLCAPKGTGFLFVRPEIQDRLHHIVVSWGYDQEGASRDQTGQLQIKNQPFLWQLSYIGTRDLACFVAVGEAVAFQEKLGKEAILSRGKKLASYLREKMAQTGWAELITPVHPDLTGLLSTFRLQGFGDQPLAQVLYERYRITTPVFQTNQVHTQRVSTHIYNRFEEMDRLVEALSELRREG